MTRYADAGISPRTNVYAAKKMLESADPVRVLDLAADVKPLPRKKTETIKFRRPITLAPVTTPLVEGVTPDITPFGYEDVEGTLRQYGQVLQVTDKIEDLHEDPVLMDMSTQVGKNVGRTNEQLMWGVLRAGTNVFYSAGSGRSDVNAAVGLNMQRNVCMALEAQYSEPLTQVLKGSVLINTTPVEAGYLAFCHTHLTHDIRSMDGFVPVAEYGTMKKMHPRELGAVEDVRYIRSPDLPPFYAQGHGTNTGFRAKDGGNIDVYPILYVGAHAYGTVPLRGEGAIEPIIVPVNMASKSDPINQRGYVGSKWWFLTLILNQMWMARLEVAATKIG